MITYDRTVHTDHCPREETMRYKVIKTISLLAIAQAGPINCPDFTAHFNSLVSEIKTRGNFVIGSGETWLSSDIWLLEWAEKDPKRIEWLIDKGFIERVEEFKPVTITLTSQEQVNQLYSVCNFAPLCEILYELEVVRKQLPATDYFPSLNSINNKVMRRAH
jgi:hypothetical protein